MVRSVLHGLARYARTSAYQKKLCPLNQTAGRNPDSFSSSTNAPRLTHSISKDALRHRKKLRFGQRREYSPLHPSQLKPAHLW